MLGESVESTLSSEEKEHYNHLVDSFLNRTLLRTSFNGSILVAKEGTIVYEKYIGYKNLGIKDTITAETPFQIASTSKTLTSAGVLKLIEEGRLSLADTLGKYFPGFPYPGVTVKMLLSQRSGLPEYLYFMDKSWPRHIPATNTDVVNFLITQKPGRTARPNTKFNYCNTNFVLLASLIEAVTGNSFTEYMEDEVFDPLNMNNTYVRTPSDSLRTANSYQWNGALWPLDFSDGPYGDKNIYATPRDLLKWDQALYNGSFINQALLDSAFTPYSNETKSTHNYGLGWRLLFFPNGKKVVYHNGHWHGFNSAFSRLLNEKVTIIILGNRYNKNIYSIARKMYNLFGDYDKNAGEVTE